MCSEVGKSTSMHGLMDALEQEVWDLFMMEVLRYDAWTWIDGHALGYTFQSSTMVMVRFGFVKMEV